MMMPMIPAVPTVMPADASRTVNGQHDPASGIVIGFVIVRVVTAAEEVPVVEAVEAATKPARVHATAVKAATAKVRAAAVKTAAAAKMRATTAVKAAASSAMEATSAAVAATATATVAAADFRQHALRNILRRRRCAWRDQRHGLRRLTWRSRQHQRRGRGEAKATDKAAPRIGNPCHIESLPE
jgi:hypothetical protein